MQIGAAYIRVSTDSQTEYSPEAQLKALKDYAKRNNILLSNEFVFRDEGISGKKADKRPGFQEMIFTAKQKPKPFDVILVHKFDRFARSREDSVVYKSLLRKECNIQVVSITEQMEDDKFSIILESMLEAMAEYYSLNLADEVKKGLFEKARRGENIGKAPYGYKLVNSALVPSETEAEIVRLVFGMYKNQSVSKIVQYLNSNNIPTKTGGRWTQTTLIYLLENPVYYGIMRYNYRKRGQRNMQNEPSEWILSESTHIPLIDKDTFNSTQKKLQIYSNAFSRNFNEKSIKSWLQHVSKCSTCGAALTVSTCDDGKYKMFRCSGANLGTCSIKNTSSSKKLEKIVLSQLISDLGNHGSLSIKKIQNVQSSNNELDILNKQIQRIKGKIELAKRAYLAQVDTLEEYKANKAQLYEEEAKTLERIKDIASTNASEAESKIELEYFLKLLSDESLSHDEKNRIVKEFIKEVRVDLKTKEIRIVYYI